MFKDIEHGMRVYKKELEDFKKEMKRFRKKYGFYRFSIFENEKFEGMRKVLGLTREENMQLLCEIKIPQAIIIKISY